MPTFRTGQKVTVANDLSNPPKVGTIVRLVREDRIEGLEGVLETKEIYLVRWIVPSGDGEQAYDQEHAGETLRLWRATKAGETPTAD